jgi:hypothetical protein
MPKPPYVHMNNGGCFQLFEPDPEVIDYHEMVSTLAKICRYGGRCHEFYSVAQHSVHCAELCERLLPGDNQAAMACLMHDSAEYLLGDVVTTIKRATYLRNSPEYTLFAHVEEDVLNCIAHKLGVPTWHTVVPLIDAALLYRELTDLTDIDPEARGLKHGPLGLSIAPIVAWDWQVADTRFHEKFSQLTE